jgi:ATP-binding cassette subfamily B protein
MNLKAYKHLLSTYGRYPGIWFALVAEIIRSLINRVLVVIIMANMAVSITLGNYPQARHFAYQYLAVALFAVLIYGAGELLTYRGENKIYGKNAIRYYKKLINKDMSFYRDNHTGYLTVMQKQYVDSSLELLRLLKTDWVRMIVSLTIPAVVLLASSFKVGLAALGLVVFQLIYMTWASSKTLKYRKVTHEIYRKISGEVADDVTNIVAFKAAGQEDAALRRMEKLEKEEINAFWLRRKTAILLEAPRGILTTMFIGVGFLLVLNPGASVSESVKLLILTITYMFQINRNIADLPELIDRHDDLVSKLVPTLEVLEPLHETVADPKEPTNFNPAKAAISIRDMSFKYSDESAGYIFKNMNIEIAAGEHVGIVGLSGAGKSTLASLLMRFDDIESGSISIDGIDIQDVKQSDLRRHIAYVPQEPVLFHRTIKENIAYHNASATQADIEKAAKAAHAHAFIMELPKNYDTVVGERGVKLSGGQKQRVVIARAVLKNAPLVLFDEATSALDSESESIIQAALPDIIGRHTAVIIAHRLSTVAGLDRIIVMHNGRIEEEGTHAQLLKNKGRYFSLWQKQTRS